MHFFLQLNISFLVSHEALIALQQKTNKKKTHQRAYYCVSQITIIPLILQTQKYYHSTLCQYGLYTLCKYMIVFEAIFLPPLI